LKYITGVIEGSGVRFDEESIVSVVDTNYIEKLGPLLNKTSKRYFRIKLLLFSKSSNNELIQGYSKLSDVKTYPVLF